jgi:hypothetical protein
MKQGIILVALSHPYYAQLATNLVMSIKHNLPDVHITLFHDTRSIGGVDEAMKRYYDNFLPIEDEFYIIDGKRHYGLMKTKLNVLAQRAGYGKALYIDVDSLMIPGTDFSKFWEAIDTHKFCMEFRGAIDVATSPASKKVGHWLALAHIRGRFALQSPTLPEFTQSSWVGFCSGVPEVEAVFTEAQNTFYHFLKFGTAAIWYNTIPDELCFAVAMGITGYPVADDLNLCYFNTTPFKPERKTILENYALFTLPSAGGVRQSYAEFYNQLVNKIAHEAGTFRAHQWKDKRKISRHPEYQPKRGTNAFIQRLKPHG